MRLKESIKGGLSNWSRLQTIIKVAAKHGLAGFLYEIGILHSADSDAGPDAEEESIPRRLRLTLQELGPTFIKFGQILSTRPDLIPAAYIEEFEKLTDRIPGFAYEDVQQIIKQELGDVPEEFFESIEPTPIAAASISQVHRARIKTETGEDGRAVVIKVQRPNIVETIQADIQILFFLAQSLEKVRSDFRLFNLTGIVREFQRTIHEELDFSLEAKNIEDISKAVTGVEAVVLPEVVWSHSTKKILTMSEIKGKTLSQMKDWPAQLDRPYLADSVAEFFLESIFFHGVFHCDAHAGNLLVIPEGRGKIGVVDFGMVGRIGPDLRDKMGRIFISMVNRDFTSLAMLYTEVADFGKSFSIREFKRDLERLLEPNMSKSLGDVDVSQMMYDSIHIARKYRIQLPRDLIAFYRAAVTLEHVGRTLNPQFTFLNLGTRFAKKMIARRLSSENLSRDFYRFFDGIRSLGTEVPGQLKNILYRLESEDLLSQGKDFRKGIQTLKRSNQLLSLSLICFGSLIGASIVTALAPNSPSVIALWTLSGLVLLLCIIQFFRS